MLSTWDAVDGGLLLWGHQTEKRAMNSTSGQQWPWRCGWHCVWLLQYWEWNPGLCACQTRTLSWAASPATKYKLNERELALVALSFCLEVISRNKQTPSSLIKKKNHGDTHEPRKAIQRYHFWEQVTPVASQSSWLSCSYCQGHMFFHEKVPGVCGVWQTWDWNRSLVPSMVTTVVLLPFVCSKWKRPFSLDRTACFVDTWYLLPVA